MSLFFFVLIYHAIGNCLSSTSPFLVPTTFPTDTTMTKCNVTSMSDNSGLSTVICTTENHKCKNWNIAVIVGLKKQSNPEAQKKIEQISSFLIGVTDPCSTASNIFLLAPGILNNSNSCNEQKTGNSGVHSLLDNLGPGNAMYRTTDSEDQEIINMFHAAQDCSSFTLKSGYAGMVIFISDIHCDDVCTSIMDNNQRQMIDSMTSKGYNVRFIRIGTDQQEQNCLDQVFNRCSQYSRVICSLSAYDSVDKAKNDTTQRFCDADSKSSFPTVWIIISSVVAFLIIIGCVGIRCFFRYKALKQGNKWSWFVWKSPETEITAIPGVADGKMQSARPNDYDEVPREADQWEIQPENLLFSENDVLGSGAFATVYMGKIKGEIPLAKMNKGIIKLGIRKEPDDTYIVAIKRLPPHATAEGRADFRHEINFMKELGYHPHVLSLLGVINSTHDAMIIVENCEHGDLLSFVRSRKESFLTTEPEAFINEINSIIRVKDLISISWQISDGMSYLASKNFIHRDIAARNILLTKSMVAKIGDFGLCRLVDSSLYTAKGGRLPIKWMAPESLKYYEYSLKSDIWSFGVLLFELFSLGEAPYGTVQPSEMPKYLDQGNRLDQPQTCPNEIYTIMTKCWQKDSADRPDIDIVREELTQLLNSDSSSYGYLPINDIFDTEVCEV